MNVAYCRKLFMDVFWIHSIALRQGLTFPTHILPPLGHYQKCGTRSTSPHLLKEWSNQGPTLNGKLKSDTDLRLLPTFLFRHLVWCCRQWPGLEGKWLFWHLCPSLLLFACVGVLVLLCGPCECCCWGCNSQRFCCTLQLKTSKPDST